MSTLGIVLAAAIVGLLGLIIGILLGIVGKVFEVEVDEKEVAVRECLPGNNCGGCGYAGCDALAAAIAKGEASASACPVGGAAAATQIAEIMGAEVDLTRYVAYVHCCGTPENASSRYTYIGNASCREAVTLNAGGSKACGYGCLGLGSCVAACEFDAIHIVNGIARVDKEECKGCSACVKACPKKLIDLVPYEQKVFVRCSSNDKGKAVKAACKVGCIGCGLCKKNCEAGAIEIVNNLAVIDYTKCVGCGKCTEKCPTKAIIMI